LAGNVPTVVPEFTVIVDGLASVALFPFLLNVTVAVGIAVQCAYRVRLLAGIVKLDFFSPPDAKVYQPSNVNPEREGLGRLTAAPSAAEL
jgi:hypothetical protein